MGSANEDMKTEINSEDLLKDVPTEQFEQLELDESEPERVINGIKITSVNPNGIFWTQAQTAEMQSLLKMQPNCDLSEISMQDCLEKVKQDRENGELHFLIKEDKEYRRIKAFGKIEQPRSELMDVVPLTSQRSREQARRQEQFILVDYLDYGYRKLVPLAKLISSSYFDKVYSTYAPQSVQMALDSKKGVGNMQLSQEAMNKLLTAHVLIEVLDPSYKYNDEFLPVVIVHFLDEQVQYSTVTSVEPGQSYAPQHYTELREQEMCIEDDEEPVKEK